MKKTVTANISGTIFNIEDDAFDLMQKYLNSIKMYFSSYEDSEEIFMDFENRISENLYSISNNANEVINSKHVAKIIEIMGKPEDFEDLEIENNNIKDFSKLRRNNNDRIIAGVASGISDYFKIDPFITRLLFVLTIPVGGFGFFFYLICWIAMPKTSIVSSTKRKKFYRDHEDKIIAGIAQGIANYFSIDAFIIRLFFIALIFVNGLGFGLYLLIWISSKYAKTIKQKMDMSGINLNVDNVKKFVNESKNKIVDSENVSKVGSKFYRIFIFPFKLVGQAFEILFPIIKRIPKVLIIFLIIYITAIIGILLIALIIIQFSLFEPNNELLALLQTIIVDLPALTLIMIYINFIISILLFSIFLIKLLSEKNVKSSTIIALSIGLFMVTSFNIINLGSNDKLEDDIEKIEDFIEDKYFLKYNYKLKIN
ncbi:MAG: PspC domain-containing protein [Flavobacteriaceae bacterium]